MNDPITRARQHLMVQGFTLYTCEAAVAMLLLKSATLRDPRHAFSVELDKRSLPLTALLADEHGPRELVAALRQAAVTAADGGPVVVCSAAGGVTITELTTSSVRGILARIQSSEQR